MRQLIIARKDLQMSPGKLSAQVAHASTAYFTHLIKSGASDTESEDCVRVSFTIPSSVYHGWICGIFTKTVCEAKNKNQLLKAVKIAESMGLKEDEDFFLIKDACLTELEPEEFDENGVGRTLTCIGFRPLPDDIAHEISRKYHLYV